MEEFNIVIERGEDEYYIGSVVELPGCHSQAKSIDKLMERMKEAIELYLEVERDIKSPQFIEIQNYALNLLNFFHQLNKFFSF